VALVFTVYLIQHTLAVVETTGYQCVHQSWLNPLSATASQTVTTEDGRNNDELGPERGGERKVAVKLDPETGDY